MMKHHTCSVYLGTVTYEQGLLYQAEARVLVEQGLWDAIFLVLQHSPVITIGKSGGDHNLLVSADFLEKAGIELVHTNRGGNITCHNPGQVVCYPVMNLKKWKTDVHWYVNEVEESVIKTLQEFGLRAGRKVVYTGVWVGNKKITAIGIGVKKWVSFHGLALNVENDMSIFSYVVPCGIQEFSMTSLRELGSKVALPQVVNVWTNMLIEVFECDCHKKFSKWSDINGRENFTATALVSSASI